MTLKLEFETDNAAFEEDPAGEVHRILREVAERVAGGSESGAIRDYNGNKIGHYELEREAAEDAAPEPLAPKYRQAVDA